MTPAHLGRALALPALLALLAAPALPGWWPDGGARAQVDDAQAAPEPQPEAPPPIPYRTTLRPSGDEALDSLLRSASALRRLEDSSPTDAEGILARILAEPERLRPAFESEGYWAGLARVVIAGAPPNAPPPTLPEILAAPRPVPLEIRPEPGPRYRLRRVVTQGPRPIPLEPGAPARADTVLDAEAAALAAWRAEGRPLARIARRVTVDHAAQAMDVEFTADPGPVARFAPPIVTGTSAVRPEVARRVAAARLGTWQYDPTLITAARTDLLALGPFGSVRAEEAAALDAEGRLPVTFHVQERPFRAISASAGFETNFGAALTLGWEHRNLFGGAERLRLEAEGSRLGSDLARTNARFGAIFRQPVPFGFDGTLVFDLQAQRQRLDSFDRDGVALSVLYERRLGRHWIVSAGPTAEYAFTAPPRETLRAAHLVGLATAGRFDNTDSALDPRRGWRLQLTATPSYSISRSQAYLPVRATASTYFDMDGEGRSILALRGSLGSLLNAKAEEVPQSQRFFAGGGGSVRGYAFQSIGPRDALGRPAGGASLIEASVEFRQRFGTSFGGVAFLDAGAVGTDAFLPTDTLRMGAGVGARYYTPFGPIRADVAMPLVRQRSGAGFGLYIGIGHAF